jgi:hypothetical protein
MTIAQHHAIRRQVLDVTVDGTEAEGLALQSRLVALCCDWLTSALDEALGRLVPGEEHWSIDRLDLDAGAFTVDSLERDLVGAVRTALENQIRERLSGRGASPRSSLGALAAERSRNGHTEWPSGGSSREDEGDDEFLRRTDAQATQDAFAHFLTTGVLPWWFRLPPNEPLEAVVSAAWNMEGRSFHAPSTLRAIASPIARLRLVRQFSEPFLEALLTILSPETARAAEEIARWVTAHPGETGRQQRLLERLWLLVFGAVSQHRVLSVEMLFADWSRSVCADVVTAPEDERVIADVARALSLPVPIASTENKQGTSDASARSPVSLPVAEAKRGMTSDDPQTDSMRGMDLEDGIFVDSAGIVLLHPFLPAMFERLGVASEGKLILPDRALALLHFLATSETRAPEYALVLPKLLCGLPLGQPVGTPVELTEGEVAEAENLLAAVIGHWSALSDASPDALRGTFLTRPGKLSCRDGDDLLQIEPQSFDVLLDRLPWGIGAIRLPWMDRMLWVEWRM